MTRGGSRNRSGPQPDPQSGRSERRAYKLTALPNEGYRGPVPDFSLEPIQLFTEYMVDGDKRREFDEGATDLFREREAAVWAEAWRSPQACAWSMEPWRWPVVAEFCRLKTVVEFSPRGNASLVAQLHRYRDQLGLTPAGLRENGWEIAPDEVGKRRAENSEPTPVAAPVRRLRSTSGDR